MALRTKIQTFSRKQDAMSKKNLWNPNIILYFFHYVDADKLNAC
jgi:hypothetical protein